MSNEFCVKWQPSYHVKTNNSIFICLYIHIYLHLFICDTRTNHSKFIANHKIAIYWKILKHKEMTSVHKQSMSKYDIKQTCVFNLFLIYIKFKHNINSFIYLLNVKCIVDKRFKVDLEAILFYFFNALL